jgi:hypothetical protein
LHELIDSWLSRGKLNYEKFSSFIDLENWWSLQTELENVFRFLIFCDHDAEVI